MLLLLLLLLLHSQGSKHSCVKTKTVPIAVAATAAAVGPNGSSSGISQAAGLRQSGGAAPFSHWSPSWALTMAANPSALAS
jgi:hypothetical protein